MSLIIIPCKCEINLIRTERLQHSSHPQNCRYRVTRREEGQAKQMPWGRAGECRTIGGCDDLPQLVYKVPMLHL
jgi:hypothetical protein